MRPTTPKGRQYDYYTASAHWFTCWPAALPAHRDVIAAHLVPYLERLTDTDRGTATVLPLLAEADGPPGPATSLALAYGLGATDATDRASTVDALLTLAALAARPGTSRVVTEARRLHQTLTHGAA